MDELRERGKQGLYRHGDDLLTLKPSTISAGASSALTPNGSGPTTKGACSHAHQLIVAPWPVAKDRRRELKPFTLSCIVANRIGIDQSTDRADWTGTSSG